jgi:hypothetical protein
MMMFITLDLTAETSLELVTDQTVMWTAAMVDDSLVGVMSLL